MSSHENLSLLQVTAADRDSNGLQEQDPGPETPDQGSRGQVDNIRRGLRRLAQLSLDDYEWRMSLFREKEADRRVEESLARMLGEDASYFRPMDASASKMGPLVSNSKCWEVLSFVLLGRSLLMNTSVSTIEWLYQKGSSGKVGSGMVSVSNR